MFDDLIGDIESNKKLSPILTELFLSQCFTCFYITLLFQIA